MSYYLIAVWTYGRVEVQFQWLKTRPAFEDEGKRLELLRRLNAIEGISISSDAVSRRPSFALATLADEARLKQFLDVLDWVAAECRSAA